MRPRSRTAIAPFRKPPYHWKQIDSGLEDVFIHLMAKAPKGQVSHEKHRWFSPARFWAVVVKEFIQMRRDRLTFAMMIGMPLMQLILFGFAINADPKHLPTAVLLADRGPYGRTLLSALQNSSYYRHSLGKCGREAEGSEAARARQGPVRRQYSGGFFARAAARRSAGRPDRSRCDRPGCDR